MTPTREQIVETFSSASLNGPENAVGFVMWRLTHRYTRSLEQALRPLDLTHLQFTVLALAAWMAIGRECVGQADVARFGDIHPMQISLILKALERKGLIRRTAMRGVAKSIAVTEVGLASLRAALPLAIAVQEHVFGAAGSPGGPFLKALLRIEANAGVLIAS